MVITLIGMPGAGKSCMGKILARRFKLKFLDGDKLIEQVTGRELHNIIAEDGIDGFKRIEEEVLLSIDEDDIVFAPGGSAVYYDSVMRKFRERGPVVYLYITPEVLTKRLGDYSKRGIVLKEGDTLADLYAERAPLFEKYADLTISCNGTAYSKYRSILINKIESIIAKENANE